MVPPTQGPAGSRDSSDPTVANLSRMLASTRVAIVCRVLWNGGVQRAVIAETEYLRAHGIPCDLIFLRATPGVKYDLPEGAEAPVAPTRSGRIAELSAGITRRFARHRGTDATVDLDLLWAARKRLRGYDVVIFNDQYGALIGGFNRLRAGRPYVLTFHEFFPKVGTGAPGRLWFPLADLIDAVSILLAPAILTTSDKVADRLGRVVSGRVTLGRLGAPTPGPPLDPARRDRRTVFSITVWDRGRHPETYLDAARLRPEFHWVLGGIWADPAHYEEVARTAKALTNVEITGPLSELERLRYLRGSLLYLRLGFNESGPGMGGLEALSEGSLVIANRGLGLAELLTSGKDGFVLENADPKEIASLLSRIDRMSAADLLQLSLAARDLALRNSWDAHGAMLLHALAQAAALRPPGSGDPHGRPAIPTRRSA
jgi:glycosyltransferase involved in cell wall biosynthesis